MWTIIGLSLTSSSFNPSSPLPSSSLSRTWLAWTDSFHQNFNWIINSFKIILDKMTQGAFLPPGQGQFALPAPLCSSPRKPFGKNLFKTIEIQKLNAESDKCDFSCAFVLRLICPDQQIPQCRRPNIWQRQRRLVTQDHPDHPQSPQHRDSLIQTPLRPGSKMRQLSVGIRQTSPLAPPFKI